MSKTSYALIALIMAALVYMGAVRLHEAYLRNRQARQEASQQDGNPFTFQNIPVSLAAPQEEFSPAPVEYRPHENEVFLEDTPLSPLQQRKQAQDTIASIMADFQQETALAGFEQEIRQVSHGRVNGLADLSTQPLDPIMQTYPEISGVVSKHLKNPDFSKAIDEIFQNPQFQQSVKQLQQNSSSAQ